MRTWSGRADGDRHPSDIRRFDAQGVVKDVQLTSSRER